MGTFTTSAITIEGSDSVRFGVTYLCNALEFWQVILCMTIVTYKMGTAIYSYKGGVMVKEEKYLLECPGWFPTLSRYSFSYPQVTMKFLIFILSWKKKRHGT